METVLEHLDDDADVHKVEAELVQCFLFAHNSSTLANHLS